MNKTWNKKNISAILLKKKTKNLSTILSSIRYILQLLSKIFNKNIPTVPLTVHQLFNLFLLKKGIYVSTYFLACIRVTRFIPDGESFNFTNAPETSIGSEPASVQISLSTIFFSYSSSPSLFLFTKIPFTLPRFGNIVPPWPFSCTQR